MNIYQRQMKELGLNLDQYSKFLDIPKSITKKIINGNGEVVKDMEINNFLRKNLFGKHQEIENNKEEKKVEALNVKLMRGENSYETKKQWLLEKYPESKEVQWYINEYDRDTYFAKNNIKNKADLMRRYTFTCNKGRLKGLKDVGISTIERLVNKKYDELGVNTVYPLICQLYDCLELGNIKANGNYKPKYNKKNINSQKGKRGFQPIKYTEEEQELRNWFKQFDLEKFVNEQQIRYVDVANNIGVPYGSIYPMKMKTYFPNDGILKKLKDYVDGFENKFETQTVTMEQAKVFDIPVDEDYLKRIEDNYNTFVTINHEEPKIEPLYNNNEEMLRNLLKDRLTEEEKTLILLFHGNLD